MLAVERAGLAAGGGGWSQVFQRLESKVEGPGTSNHQHPKLKHDGRESGENRAQATPRLHPGSVIVLR